MITWWCQQCLQDQVGEVRFNKQTGLSLCEKCEAKLNDNQSIIAGSVDSNELPTYTGTDPTGLL